MTEHKDDVEAPKPSNAAGALTEKTTPKSTRKGGTSRTGKPATATRKTATAVRTTAARSSTPKEPKFPDLPQSYPTDSGEQLINVGRAWAGAGPIVVSIVPKGWHGADVQQFTLGEAAEIHKALGTMLKAHKGQN